MSTAATVPTARFRDADLPPVCAWTGAPADSWRPIAAKSRIGAQWWLLLLGIVPFVLVRALTTARVHGFLPASESRIAEAQAKYENERAALIRRALPRVLGAAGIAAAATLAVQLARYQQDDVGYPIQPIVVAATVVAAAVLAVVYGSAAQIASKKSRAAQGGIPAMPRVWLDRSGERTFISRTSRDFEQAAKDLVGPPPPSPQGRTITAESPEPDE